ncbi:nucleotide exchange factor GrpE [bacterium]|nr:nucleotide exchange factor GrpE [bacterium]
MSKGRKKTKAAAETVEEVVETPETENEEVAEESAEELKIDPEAVLQALLEAQMSQWKDREDQLLRTLSEKENQVKRMSRDLELSKSRQKGELVHALLDILDDLDRALENRPEDADTSFVEGIELVSKRFHKALAGLGLEAIKALGEPFDPQFHEALLQLPDVDAEAGTVIQEIQKGYLISGRVLRPSKVAVAG